MRRKISLLQQVPVMFPMTVEENLNLSPGVVKISLDEKKEIFNSLGLNENGLGKMATELSIGQAQRVAFIRCLMNQPEVMLLDEPTAPLDKKNKMKLFETILKYTKENKMTILWVTHDPSLIEKYPFKKFLLKDKRIHEI
jgi:ABC-type lipoprotein export system ATPase subunit